MSVRSTILTRAAVAVVITVALLVSQAVGQSYYSQGFTGINPAGYQSFHMPPASTQFDSWDQFDLWEWKHSLDPLLRSGIHDPGVDRYSLPPSTQFDSWEWKHRLDPMPPGANLFQEFTTNSTSLTDMNPGREVAKSVGTSITLTAVSDASLPGFANLCGASLSAFYAGRSFGSWLVAADVMNGELPPEAIKVLGIPGVYAYAVSDALGGFREYPANATYEIHNTQQIGSTLIDEHGTVSIQRTAPYVPPSAFFDLDQDAFTQSAFSETRTFDITTVERQFDPGDMLPFGHQSHLPSVLLDRTLPQAIDWQTGFNVSDLIDPTINTVDKFQILPPIKPIDLTLPPSIDLYNVINPMPLPPTVNFSPMGGRY